jgi:thioredoxin 1
MQIHSEKDLSVEAFNELVSDENQLVFVDFYATWCEPCKFLDEILEELAPRVAPTTRFVKLDIDEHPALQKEFTIMSVPTLMIYRKGEQVWRMAGFGLAKDMEEIILKFKI